MHEHRHMLCSCFIAMLSTLLAVGFVGGFPADAQESIDSAQTTPTPSSADPVDQGTGNATPTSSLSATPAVESPAATNSEDITIATQSNDDELTPQADPVCQIGTTTYTTLGAALTAATDGQTIEMLVSDYTFTNTDCTSISGKSITLTKAASVTTCTITRSTKATMVTVGTGTLTMKNLTIEGGGSTLAANNQTFVMAADGKISAQNCTFQNIVNAKSTGGQYRGGVFYGTQFVSSELTLNSCTFNNCSANYGGVCLSYSKVSASGCTFTGCAATGNGGGAFFVGASGSLTATDSSFYGCTATGNGGAINCEYPTSVSVDGCTFGSQESPCKAAGNGGAIYMPDGSTLLKVTNSAFSYCTATNGAGGAIESSATTNTFEGTAEKPLTIKNCSSGSNGGGIYIFGNVTGTTVSHVRVADCSSNLSGGGICLSVTNPTTSTATVSDLSVSNCKATNNSGGFYSNCGTTSLNGTVAEPITITGCNAGNNGGGLLLASTVTTGTMTNTTISSCTAGNSGGGLYVDGTSTTADRLTATDVTISNNTATKYGGGAYTAGATLTNCSITGNTATNARGGGLETFGQPTTITGCTISNNTSGNSGGGIDTNGPGPLTISSTTISGNQATGSSADGGGIFMTSYTSGAAVVHLGDETNITGNTCGRNTIGGGIGCDNASGQLYVSDVVKVTGNTNKAGLASNVGLRNTSSSKSNYEVYVEGTGLKAGSAIGVITNDGAKGELCVKGADSYTLTATSDIDYFTHDRITRGEELARLILWDADTSTYILGGSQYQVQYWFNDGTNYVENEDLRVDDVDYAATVIDQAALKKTFSGYTFTKLQYSTDNGTTWTDMPAGYTLPDADGTLIRALYDPITYQVTFVSEDTTHGTVSGATTQQIQTGRKVTDGTVTVTPITADDWFFTGWSYTTTHDDSSTTMGYAYDYSTVPIEGATVFTARFAKQPFASIITSGGGAVSVTAGAAAEDVPDGQLTDVYEWEAGSQTKYTATGAFRAAPHYHVTAISTVRPAATGDTNVTELDIASSTAQTLNPVDTSGAQAVISMNAAKTYGTIQVSNLPKAVSIRVTFEKDPSYKVSFYSNDGTTTTLFEEHEDLYDSDVIGAAPTNIPTRDGYTFMGWTTVAPADQTSTTRPDYDAGSRITAADQTYYALWQADSTLSYQTEIYLQNIGSTDAEDKTQYTLTSSSSYPVNINASTTLPVTVTELPTDPVTHPSYAGYTYKAFYADGTTAFSNDTGTITTTDDNLVLRLYYTRTSGTLNMYDSDGTTELYPAEPRDYGEALDLYTSAKTPIKAGYTFEGWYYDTDFTKPVGTTDTMGVETALTDGKLNVYARWSTDTRKGTLTVTKTASGDYADKTKKFHYAVTVTQDGTANNLTADLADGESATFKGVDLGTTYTVTKTAVTGYTPSVAATLPDGGTANVTTDKLTVTGTVAYGTDTQAGKTTIAYTNTMANPVVTGVSDNNRPFTILTIIAILGMAIVVFLGHRRHTRHLGNHSLR